MLPHLMVLKIRFFDMPKLVCPTSKTYQYTDVENRLYQPLQLKVSWLGHQQLHNFHVKPNTV